MRVTLQPARPKDEPSSPFPLEGVAPAPPDLIAGRLDSAIPTVPPEAVFGMDRRFADAVPMADVLARPSASTPPH